MQAQVSFLDMATLNIGYYPQDSFLSLSHSLRLVNNNQTLDGGVFQLNSPTPKANQADELNRFTVGITLQRYRKNPSFGATFTYNDLAKPQFFIKKAPKSSASTQSNLAVHGKSLSLVFWHKTTFYQNLHLSSHYQTFLYLSGSPDFKTVTQEIPQHRVVNALIFRPYPSFSLSLLQLWQSKTSWIIDHQVTEDPLIRYQSLTAPLDIRAYINKSLFQNRFYVTFGFNNLLNKPISEYPIGAQNDMMFEINAGLQLVSYRNGRVSVNRYLHRTP